MQTAAQLVQIIREEMKLVLATKTSWGRNELELEFERVLNRALIRYMDTQHLDGITPRL